MRGGGDSLAVRRGRTFGAGLGLACLLPAVACGAAVAKRPAAEARPPVGPAGGDPSERDASHRGASQRDGSEPHIAEPDASHAAPTRRHLRARLQEAEAKLGLSRAEARQLRSELLAERAAVRRRVTVIGRRPLPGAGADAADVQDYAATASRPARRPLLRLYGRASSASEVSVLPGPPPPALVAPPPPPTSGRLPMGPGRRVVTIPRAPVPVASSEPRSSVPESTAEQVGDAAYRHALRLVTQRRWAEAKAAFAALLRRWPRAARVLYWSAEADYALRRYREAMRGFRLLIRSHPDAPLVADAWLRVGLCLKRMGYAEQAERVFQLHRSRYGTSAARRWAKTTSGEGPS